MKSSFFDIQSAETRRIWFAASMLFLAYALGIYLIFLALFHILPTPGGLLGLHTPALQALLVGPPLAAGLIAIQLWYAETYGVQSILDSLGAQAPDPDDRYHQRFQRIVDELGVAAGGIRAKPVIVPSLACNAFAVADARQNVIGVTEGILSRLNRAQTQAVVAHEMAHLANQDSRLASWVCSMSAPFLAFARSLDALGDDEHQDGPELGAALAAVMTAMLNVFISRRRELRADAKAVQLSRDPRAIAEALHRIAFENHFLGSASDAFSPIFVVPSTIRPLDEGEGMLSDLFSSHPPVGKRIEAMLGMANISLEELKEGIDESRQAAAAPTVEEIGGGNGRWAIRTPSGWDGPHDAFHLLTLGTFGPQTWVRSESDDGDGAPACEVPELNRLLRERDHTRRVGGACPRCGTSLRRTIYEGLPVASCPNNDGYLVAMDRVRRILGRREAGFDDAFRKKAEDWLNANYATRKGQRFVSAEEQTDLCRCPICNDRMQRRTYSYQYHLLVDRCYGCEVIWFDREELELLQALVERNQEMGFERPESWKA